MVVDELREAVRSGVTGIVANDESGPNGAFSRVM
jgi:hypothetical protein